MNRRAMALLLIAFPVWAAAAETVQIKSTVDGEMQSAIAFLPDEAGAKPIPLLVLLHSWSGDYRQKGRIEPSIAECAKRGWALIHPDFRGPNRRSEACASDLAVQDILDAVAYMQKRTSIDPKRIYLSGTSGGGHMSLVMATRAPQLWAGVSAWVPISDLAKWHADTSKAKLKYAAEIEKVCGGPPGASAAVDAEYRKRSPLFDLPKAKGLAIDINAGIHDGHKGSVPIDHSLLAFNVLAEANGLPRRRVRPERIKSFVLEQRVPEELKAERVDEPGRKHKILFRRAAGPARVTLFEGGHEGDPVTAIRWLAQQSR